MVISLISILEAETDSSFEFEVSLLYIVTYRSAKGSMYVCGCAIVHIWKSEHNLQEPVLFFHNVGAGLSGLPNNCFYPLIHLVSSSPLRTGARRVAHW